MALDGQHDRLAQILNAKGPQSSHSAQRQYCAQRMSEAVVYLDAATAFINVKAW